MSLEKSILYKIGYISFNFFYFITLTFLSRHSSKFFSKSILFYLFRLFDDIVQQTLFCRMVKLQIISCFSYIITICPMKSCMRQIIIGIKNMIYQSQTIFNSRRKNLNGYLLLKYDY